MKETKRLTGEELEQTFQEGLKYLESLAGKKELVVDSGRVRVIVVHSPERDIITDFKVHLKFPTREEVYRIDSNRGLRGIFIYKKDVVDTTILGDLSSSEEVRVGSGWRRTGEMEFKTAWRPGTPDYEQFIEEQRLQALEVVDWLKSNIEQ